MQSVTDLYDLKSFARLGLLDAVRRYQPSRGAFRTYAWGRIRGEIMDRMRQSDWWGREGWKHGRSRSRVLDIDRLDRNGLGLLDSMPDDRCLADHEDVDAQDLADWLTRGLRRIPAIIFAGIVAERSQDEIARSLGLSPSRVSQLWSRTRLRLQQRYATLRL